MMVDPYEFIVRDSAVSSSQEDLLERLPGWQEQQEAGSPFSPSQTRLALSRLCGSGSSNSEDEEEREPVPASAFCMQEPLEWASPETCENDSYNPAFESDRSRSLSPLAPLHDLWASRLVTQSQNDVGMPHYGVFPLEEASKKNNVPQAAGVGFELFYRQQPDVHFGQDTSGQAQNLKTVAMSGTQKQYCVAPLRDMPRGSNPFGECDEGGQRTELQAGNGRPEQMVEPLKADKLTSSKKMSASGAVDEPSARAPSRIATLVSIKTRYSDKTQQDEDPDRACATSAQNLKLIKEPNYQQQRNQRAHEVNCHNEKEFQSKKQAGEDCVSGSKCSLPLIFDKENIVSTSRMEKSIDIETEIVRADGAMGCTVKKLFPISVMDVMARFSEGVPTPSPHEPDFLSVVMSTGVSLPLPFRDCSGRLIPRRSTS